MKKIAMVMIQRIPIPHILKYSNIILEHSGKIIRHNVFRVYLGQLFGDDV